MELVPQLTVLEEEGVSRIYKLGRFLGRPRAAGPPVFVNSMPKAGTNLLENLLVSLGYKRNWSRCLNETTFPGSTLHPRLGHFYIGHILDDRAIHDKGFQTYLLKRELWACLKSYANYMYLDNTHPISRFIRRAPTIATLTSLFFTDRNPNGRPLVDEYLRFDRLNPDDYTLCIAFDDLINGNPVLLKRIALSLNIEIEQVAVQLRRAIDAASFTKNAGRIDVFEGLPLEQVHELKQRVEYRESSAVGGQSQLSEL